MGLRGSSFDNFKSFPCLFDTIVDDIVNEALADEVLLNEIRKKFEYGSVYIEQVGK